MFCYLGILLFSLCSVLKLFVVFVCERNSTHCCMKSIVNSLAVFVKATIQVKVLFFLSLIQPVFKPAKVDAADTK